MARIRARAGTAALTALATTALLVGCALQGPAAPTALRPPTLPKAALTPDALKEILPSGASLGGHLVLRSGQTFMVIATTAPAGIQPGWVMVGRWAARQKHWTLLWSHQAFGDNEGSLTPGPAHGATQTAAITYYDGATGFFESIVVLGVKPHAVSVLRSIYVENGQVTATADTLRITGANYVEVDRWRRGRWVHAQETLRQVVGGAPGVHVFYVEQVNYGSPASISLVGPSHVTIHVGQTVTFTPGNATAWASLAAGHTSIWQNGGGNAPVLFAMVNLTRGNTVTFTSPGSSTFLIDPSVMSTAASPNMARVVVTVLPKAKQR